MSSVSPLFPQIHGHRGCRGLLPENTLPAFLRAVELGVDTLELDVVISADQQVVVSHEPWMSATICRTPDGLPITDAGQFRHNLYSMPYARIRTYDCGSVQHPLFPEQQPQWAYKPLLREVLAAADARARELGRPPLGFSVEVKSSPDGDGIWHPAPPEFLSLVVAELQQAAALARTTLLTFDKRILREARQWGPALRLCLLVEDTAPLADHLRELGFLPDVVGPDFRLLTPPAVAELRRLGVELIPWTVNELADLHTVLRYHPLGITTDYPDRLIAVRNSFTR
ncbi:glycerophosphodiester phosphodiesterase family protein [Hymenobacter sp. 102]|uniref:glycerophosphodiester phosphodiesterase family protein n=1 Tax=Hymenobacter sp. 102 TaxID=3403152 RepID=UPI003CF74C99